MKEMMDKTRKPRIAILGDFPIGKVYSRYAENKSTCAGWLYNFYDVLNEVEDFEIHWIVVDKVIEDEEDFQIGKQWFHLLPGCRHKIGLYTAYAYNRYQVAKCVKKIKPDIFHGWGTERFYGLAAKDFKGKSLVSAQGVLIACGRRAQISNFEKTQCWYEKSVFKSVDYVTTESAWARDRVLELAPDAEVILWEYAPDKCFFDLTRKLTKEPTCLWAGTHSPVKDVTTTIQAFSSPELSHVTLYLAGINPGSITDLPPNVIPLGRISKEEIAEYLGKVWCLVHSSVADSSPNIVKEARVVGVPAVVTSECGGKQYIEHGKSGFVISPRNVNAMKDSVLLMTESAEKSLEMGAYKRDVCRKQLCRDTMRDIIVRLYHKIYG